jgi:hypothetical protein
MENKKKFSDDDKIDLSNKTSDYAAMLIKNLVASGVPVVLPMFTFLAPYLGDLIANVIPQQRIDRVVNFVKLQSEKLEKLDKNLQDKIKETMLDPETVPFMEKLLKMVVESETEQKRKYLASVLKNGLSVEIDVAHRASLLKIIEQLEDLDILRLYGASLDEYDQEKYEAFWYKYENIFYFEPEWDDDEEADRKAMFSRMPTDKLIRLDLLNGDKIDAGATRLGKEILSFIDAEENIDLK